MKNHEEWIDRLRMISCFAVIITHIIGGTYVVEANVLAAAGIRSFVDLALLTSLTRWAVPVFVMISGYLLLDPGKDITIERIKSYIVRMLAVLATFGLLFCTIESFVLNRSLGLGHVLVSAVKNLLCENSWAHMWYIYMLIGLYVLTPVLRAFTLNASKEELFFILSALFALSIAVPTVNDLFGLSVTTFFLSRIFLYIFYFLFGHCVRIFKISKKTSLLVGTASFVILLVISSVRCSPSNSVFSYSNIFVALLSMSIFCFSYGRKAPAGRLVLFFSKRSFYIYLVHTFLINLLNKGLNHYITNYPVLTGEALFFIAALAFSLFTYEIASRIPGLRRII